MKYSRSKLGNQQGNLQWKIVTKKKKPQKPISGSFFWFFHVLVDMGCFTCEAAGGEWERSGSGLAALSHLHQATVSPRSLDHLIKLTYYENWTRFPRHPVHK